MSYVDSPTLTDIVGGHLEESGSLLMLMNWVQIQELSREESQREGTENIGRRQAGKQWERWEKDESG